MAVGTIHNDLKRVREAWRASSVRGFDELRKQSSRSKSRKSSSTSARLEPLFTDCRALGPEQTSELPVRHGRHTFISHALAGGRTLAKVRDAAGHGNVSITSVYLHVAVDDDGQTGNLFGFRALRRDCRGCLHRSDRPVC